MRLAFGGNHKGVRRHPILVFIVVVGVLFVVVDRVAAWTADRVIAHEIQRSEGLQRSPDVSVDGFPLLTQVARQRYGEVEVVARDLRRGSIVSSLVDVRLYGVHVATGALISRDVRRVPVDHAEGAVLFRYSDIDRMLAGSSVSVAYGGGDRLRVSAPLAFAGQRVTASGTATARIDGDELVVSPQSVDVGGGSFVNGALSSLARDRLTVRLSLAGLPFGVHVDHLDVRPDGVLAHAVSSGFVIDVGSH